MGAVIEGELVNVPVIRTPTDLLPLAHGVVSDAMDVSIDTREDYERISQSVSTLKGHWNTCEAARKKIKAPLDAGIAALQDFFNGSLLHPLAKAEGILKDKLLAYRREEQRREEERIAREQDARREAEREAARLQAEADARQAAADKAKRDAEQAAAGGDRQAAITAARAALRAAKEAGAAKLQAETQQAVATLPVAKAEPVKVAGQSTMKKYRFRVIDRAKVEDKWLTINEASVQEFCDRMKDKAQEHLPGFEVYVEEVLRSRAG